MDTYTYTMVLLGGIAVLMALSAWIAQWQMIDARNKAKELEEKCRDAWARLTNLGHGHIPTRYESLRFLMELDKTRADKFQTQLTTLGSQVGLAAASAEEGDTLEVSYALDMIYFGNVVSRLEALRDILSDPAVVVKADLNELNYGECLLAATLDRLRAAQEVIRQRNG